MVRLERGVTTAAANGSAAADTFTADWSVSTASGTVSGTAQGEARLLDGTWHLRGGAVLRSGTWTRAQYGSAPSPLSDETPPPPRQVWTPFDPRRVGTSGAYGAGGFWADIAVHTSDSSDDTLRWQADPYINTP